jgi:hypothetical protein
MDWSLARVQQFFALLKSTPCCEAHREIPSSSSGRTDDFWSSSVAGGLFWCQAALICGCGGNYIKQRDASCYHAATALEIAAAGAPHDMRKSQSVAVYLEHCYIYTQ